jgi:transcription elongation factor GreA
VDKLYVSREGLTKLRDDLAKCKARRMEVAAIIEHARGFGDLRENADYHAAKEEQAMLHARIRDLEDKVARSEVFEDHQIDISKAFMGAVVRVLNLKTKKEFTYTLVSPVEADMAKGKISVRSPVGEALLGKSVGESAVANVPAGNIELKVLEISRQGKASEVRIQ